MTQKRPTPGSRRTSYKPQVDALEDRCLLTTNVNPALSSLIDRVLPSVVSAIDNFLPDRPHNSAGVNLSTHALRVVEGESATYTISLRTRPTADVKLSITQEPDPIVYIQGMLAPFDPANILPPHDEVPVRLEVSPAELTFTPENWDQPQTVTVTATAQDATARGRLGAALLRHDVTSDDANYDDLFVIPVGVFVHDPVPTNPGSLVLSSDHVQLIQGQSATYTIALGSQPTSDVNVAIRQEDLAHILGSPDGTRLPGTARLTISPATLTFTAENWNVPQTVTITALAEDTLWLPADVALIRHEVTSADPNYDGIRTAPLRVVVHDAPPAHPPGVRVGDRPVVLTPENNFTDTFRVALASQPTAPVTITISELHTFLPMPFEIGANGAADVATSTSGPLTLTITPTTLTFTPENWDQPQIVTVTGQDVTLDPAVGRMMFAPTPTPLLGFAVTSDDPNYNNLWVPPIGVRVVQHREPPVEMPLIVETRPIDTPMFVASPVQYTPPADNTIPAPPARPAGKPGVLRRRVRRPRRRPR